MRLISLANESQRSCMWGAYVDIGPITQVLPSSAFPPRQTNGWRRVFTEIKAVYVYSEKSFKSLNVII